MPLSAQDRLLLRPSALARVLGDGAWLVRGGRRRIAQLVRFPNLRTSGRLARRRTG